MSWVLNFSKKVYTFEFVVYIALKTPPVFKLQYWLVLTYLSIYVLILQRIYNGTVKLLYGRQ